MANIKKHTDKSSSKMMNALQYNVFFFSIVTRPITEKISYLND